MFLASCEHDNYAPPQLSYSGQLMYKGEPFLSDGNPGLGILKVVQSGYGKVDQGVGFRVAADGSFHQSLYAGDYGLTLENRPYPFEFDDFQSAGIGEGYDTIFFSLNDNVVKNFNVTPYWEISEVQASNEGLDVVANFTVTKVEGTESPAPPIIKARVYLSTSVIVNSATTVVGEVEVNVTEDGVISVPVSVLSYRNSYKNNFRDFAFYRVALELGGIPDYYLFSGVKKVEDIPLEFDDITEEYMVNYEQEFEVAEWFDGRRARLTGWSTSSPEIEFTMYDGWGDRRFMSAEQWCGPNPLTGGVWQTTTLPAGKYVFLAKRGWNHWDLSGTDRAYLAIAGGDGLQWGDDFIGVADAGLPQNSGSMAINFELSQETEVSLGYVVNFPGGECNAVSFTSFSLIKVN